MEHNTHLTVWESADNLGLELESTATSQSFESPAAARSLLRSTLGRQAQDYSAMTKLITFARRS